MTPTPWPPARIRELRRALGETQAVFAARFGRSGRAVEAWEQGRRSPDPLVLVALDGLRAEERTAATAPGRAAARQRSSG